MNVLLASGGMDSTVLAYWLVRERVDFIPLFVDYGQHCAKRELESLNAVMVASHLPRLVQIDLSSVYRDSKSRLIVEPDLWNESISHEDLHLPYRNLLLLSAASAFVQVRGGEAVYAGFINSNHALELDCSAVFFQQLHTLLSSYGSVEVRMPFRDMTKAEVARIGLEVGAPIAETFSCQAQSRTPCGACPNCVDRLSALRELSEPAEEASHAFKG